MGPILDPVEQSQEIEIARARPNLGVEPLHGFQVVVKDIRMGRNDRVFGAVFAQEVRGEHLDRRVRRCLPDGSNNRREMLCAAIGQIDRCNHDMCKPETLYGTGDTGRLEGVKRAWLSRCHIAKRAGPCANRAHDHHGGVLFGPAFSDVWTGVNRRAKRDQIAA